MQQSLVEFAYDTALHIGDLAYAGHASVFRMLFGLMSGQNLEVMSVFFLAGVCIFCSSLAGLARTIVVLAAAHQENVCRVFGLIAF